MNESFTLTLVYFSHHFIFRTVNFNELPKLIIVYTLIFIYVISFRLLFVYFISIIIQFNSNLKFKNENFHVIQMSNDLILHIFSYNHQTNNNLIIFLLSSYLESNISRLKI